jgi:hypothetical protein
MTKNAMLKGGAGVAAAVALAVGGVAVSSGSGSTTTTPSSLRGTPPAGGPRGFGTPVTGAAAAKAKAAALARYPGSVERVMKAPTGTGYEVHVMQSGGSEVHVLVSSSFQVTGTETGGPPSGARPQPPQSGGSTT